MNWRVIFFPCTHMYTHTYTHTHAHTHTHTHTHTHRLLVILEELADGYPISNETVIIAKNMFATAIYPQFNTTVFLGEGFSADLGDTFIFNRIDKENIGLSASEDATASINLPSTLFNVLTLSNNSAKLVFSFFLNDGLFVRRREQQPSCNPPGEPRHCVTHCRWSGRLQPCRSGADYLHYEPSE